MLELEKTKITSKEGNLKRNMHSMMVMLFSVTSQKF